MQPTTPAPQTPEPKPYAWQTCLDIRHASGEVYDTHFNPRLLDSFAHAPRVLLDIGCSAGVLGAFVREQNPGCRTVGIEPNEHAAKVAASRLHHVSCSTFEEFDFAAAQLTLGSIDTVVAADVLEHMHNPWQVMTTLRPYLTQDAQFIISIPNTRHLGLIKSLADDGAWTYEEKGLLDITHIRFFTLFEMTQFLHQTGYRMEHVNFFLDHRLETFYAENKDKPSTNIRLGRMSIENVPAKELAELCAWQFFIRARPR